MSQNKPEAYGLDVKCLIDADEFLSTCVGLPTVVQDVLHRLTTDDVLGPNGDGWGFDCRRLLGMQAERVSVMLPILEEVACRDERVSSAHVNSEISARGDGTNSLTLLVECMTALGPFRLVLDVTAIAEGAWPT